jgi:hypothetical protein
VKNGVTAIAGGNFSITVDDSWVYAELPSGKVLMGAEVEYEPEEEAPRASRTPTLESISGTPPTEPADEEEFADEATGALVLNPCYEVHRVQTPQGIAMNCFPYGLFSRPVNVTVLPAVVVRIEDLDEADRKGIVELVKIAEKIRLEMRASASGLTLAGSVRQ